MFIQHKLKTLSLSLSFSVYFSLFFYLIVDHLLPSLIPPQTVTTNSSPPSISIGSAVQQFSSQHHYHPITSSQQETVNPSTNTCWPINTISPLLPSSVLSSPPLSFSPHPLPSQTILTCPLSLITPFLLSYTILHLSSPVSPFPSSQFLALPSSWTPPTSPLSALASLWFSVDWLGDGKKEERREETCIIGFLRCDRNEGERGVCVFVCVTV